jgi:ABC-type multidrug transport system fused ATPase/permease subunit
VSTDRDAYRAGWRMLGRELARQRGALLRVAAWSVPESLPALLSGLLVARALDSGFLAHRPWAGLGWLAGLALILILKAVATRMSFPWLRETIEPLRDSLVRALVAGTLRRAAASSQRPDTSSVAQLTSQVEMTRQLVSALIRTLRPLAFSLIAAIAGMALLSPAIPALVLPPLAVALLLFYASLGSLSRRRTDMVVAAETIAKEAGTVLAGLRDVIACGAQDRAAADVGAAIDAQARATQAVAWAGSVRVAIVALGYYVPLIALLLAAPWLGRHGWLTSGQLIGAVTYLTASVWPVLSSLTGSVGSWGLQLGAVLRRLDQACTPPSPAPGHRTARPDGSDLRISGLTFAYGAAAEPVIQDLSLTLAAGEHLAIVGPSGIGKSTLARLVAGIQAGQRGQITIGGAAVPLIPEPVLRQQIALIPQEAYIFGGTLRENLTYLRPGATDAELDACSAAVGLTPLLDRLGGYDAILDGRDIALSDGERQLIAASRVYLSRATLVILDEATCHLDPAAEARVERAFAGRGGSLVVIAHRMSSARRAQRILVLDGSRAMLGTHRHLAEVSPRYADLVGTWAPGTDELAARLAPTPASRHPSVGYPNSSSAATSR